MYKLQQMDNFEELEAKHPMSAAELLKEVGYGSWQEEQIMCYESLEDYAVYEVFEGWYNALGINARLNYRGAPALEYFIDFKGLGAALSNNWDISTNFLTEQGFVLTTSHGW